MPDKTPDLAVGAESQVKTLPPSSVPQAGTTPNPNPNQPSPLRVEIESKVKGADPQEGERILADLLKRLDSNQATPAEAAMVQRQVQVIQLTCRELRMACAKNPDHDLAAHFAGAIRDYPDTQTICIEQPDLQALIQNRKMVIRHHDSPEGIVLTKSVE